jgi:hypothetical protein
MNRHCRLSLRGPCRLKAAWFGPVLVTFLTCACAAGALSGAQVSKVNGEIQAAHAVGAHNDPQAALYLKLATDELAAAKRLSDNGEGQKARLTLERARVDAQLAIVLSKETLAREEARAALHKVRQVTMREPATRTTP